MICSGRQKSDDWRAKIEGAYEEVKLLETIDCEVCGEAKKAWRNGSTSSRSRKVWRVHGSHACRVLVVLIKEPYVAILKIPLFVL